MVNPLFPGLLSKPDLYTANIGRGEQMELYRFTGALTGLLISGGISGFFFICGSQSKIPTGSMFIYMLVPAMVLFGFLFDVQVIWKTLARISKKFRPSFIGSSAFWTLVWPFCWLCTDILARGVIYFRNGDFLMPEYLTSFGFNGILGFFLLQAGVGTGMGLMFFLAYRPVFEAISVLRIKLGMAEADYEMTIDEELGEFGFRK